MYPIPRCTARGEYRAITSAHSGARSGRNIRVEIGRLRRVSRRSRCGIIWRSKTSGGADTGWIRELRGQGRLVRSVKRGTQSWREGFGDVAIVLFIEGHIFWIRGADRRATCYGIAALLEDLQAWWHQPADSVGLMAENHGEATRKIAGIRWNRPRQRSGGKDEDFMTRECSVELFCRQTPTPTGMFICAKCGLVDFHRNSRPTVNGIPRGSRSHQLLP